MRARCSGAVSRSRCRTFPPPARSRSRRSTPTSRLDEAPRNASRDGPHAMHPVTLVLVVHDHQPVGNFEGVFDECHARCYEPFLGFLESHPTLRIGMHVSGPLLDWLV